MPDDSYDPACIRLLAGMEPPKRPAGFIQDGPAWRVALRAEDLSDAEMAAIMAARPIGPGYSLDHIPDVPDRHASRAALRARDAALDASRETIPGVDDGPFDEAGIEAEAVRACRELARERAVLADRHPVEDGLGSSVRVELSVRVLVGLERSTVIVADPLTGRALTREVLPHGREADVAAAAVEAAIRARLPGAPGGVAGGSLEPPGEPRE